jgi:hypothetical protein
MRSMGSEKEGRGCSVRQWAWPNRGRLLSLLVRRGLKLLMKEGMGRCLLAIPPLEQELCHWLGRPKTAWFGAVLVGVSIRNASRSDTVRIVRTVHAAELPGAGELQRAGADE